MSQMIGEIRLFTYDDIPKGWLKCDGQSLNIREYPKLYMLVGNKFGQKNEQEFSLPDLVMESPKGLVYCIAVTGLVPVI